MEGCWCQRDEIKGSRIILEREDGEEETRERVGGAPASCSASLCLHTWRVLGTFPTCSAKTAGQKPAPKSDHLWSELRNLTLLPPSYDAKLHFTPKTVVNTKYASFLFLISSLQLYLLGPFPSIQQPIRGDTAAPTAAAEEESEDEDESASGLGSWMMDGVKIWAATVLMMFDVDCSLLSLYVSALKNQPLQWFKMPVNTSEIQTDHQLIQHCVNSKGSRFKQFVLKTFIHLEIKATRNF